MSLHAEPATEMGIGMGTGVIPRAADVGAPVRENGSAPVLQSVAS